MHVEQSIPCDAPQPDWMSSIVPLLFCTFLRGEDESNTSLRGVLLLDLNSSSGRGDVVSI